MKYLYFVWKNLTRKKVRTTLTVLSIVIAFILFGFLSALKQAFVVGNNIEGTTRLVTMSKVSFVRQLPVNYVDQIKRLNGVKAVTHQTLFGAYYQEPKNSFAQFPVDKDSYFEVYEQFDLPEEQIEAWKNNRIGALIGESIAKHFNWKIGDRIPLISTVHSHGGDFTWEFEIEGIFSSSANGNKMMLFHYDYFDEGRDFGKGEIGWMGIRIDEADRAAEIANQIDALFENSSSVTKTSSENAFKQAFAKQFADIGLITQLILSAVFFTMLLITGNTMAQTIRERTNELAVMKTIGFLDSSILMLVLAESIGIALIGAAIGLGATHGIISQSGEAIQSSLPGFEFTSTMAMFGMLLAVGFGLVAGIFPAIKAMRLNVATALRR